MFIEMIRPIFIDPVQHSWELLFTWSLSIPERIDSWLSTIIFDSSTSDLAKNEFVCLFVFIYDYLLF